MGVRLSFHAFARAEVRCDEADARGLISMTYFQQRRGTDTFTIRISKAMKGRFAVGDEIQIFDVIRVDSEGKNRPVFVRDSAPTYVADVIAVKNLSLQGETPSCSWNDATESCEAPTATLLHENKMEAYETLDSMYDDLCGTTRWMSDALTDTFGVSDATQATAGTVSGAAASAIGGLVLKTGLGVAGAAAGGLIVIGGVSFAAYSIWAYFARAHGDAEHLNASAGQMITIEVDEIGPDGETIRKKIEVKRFVADLMRCMNLYKQEGLTAADQCIFKIYQRHVDLFSTDVGQTLVSGDQSVDRMSKFERDVVLGSSRSKIDVKGDFERDVVRGSNEISDEDYDDWKAQKNLRRENWVQGPQPEPARIGIFDSGSEDFTNPGTLRRKPREGWQYAKVGDVHEYKYLKPAVQGPAPDPNL